MAEPKVSILIPAYNAEAWLGLTIQSALDQVWPNTEIIVVNDGSRDATLEIAQSFQSHRVRVVNQDNQGAARARNHAFSLAQGEYIQWLDADDLLAPEKLSRQLRAAREFSGKTLLSSAFGTFYSNPARAVFTPGPLWTDLSPVDWITAKFANNTWMNPAVWLVSRELTEAAGVWNPELSLDDDGEYFCRVVAASEMVRFVPEAHSFYRQWNPASLSRSAGDRACLSLLKSLKLNVGYLLSLEDSDRTRAAARSYLQVWVGYFYPDKLELLSELQALARELGGELGPPRLSPKYRVIRQLLGWRAAKKTAGLVAAAKLGANMHWDRLRSAFKN